MPRIVGEVEFPAVPRPVDHGVLRVRLLEVSRADAAATTVAERTINDVSARSVADHVRFGLDVPALDPALTYAVEGHLDADGSGEVSVGDYRTMEHFEVTAATVEDPVTIRLRPIG
jgi:hypothetical protein